LELRLDSPLPTALTIGAGTALFVAGVCFDRLEPLSQLSFVLDGEEQPVAAYGMPRLDELKANDAPTSYRSGFWGIVRIAPRAPGHTLELELRASTIDGRSRTEPLARIEVLAPPPPASAPAATVAICMATYDPPPELFRRQIESIRAQTHTGWVCVISDDASRPDRYAAIQQIVGDDPRFVVSRARQRLGFYRNFERALALAPRDTRFVALADQDDYWYPDKLTTLLGAIKNSQLVYSDQRIIARDGEEIASTYWSRRRNNHTDLDKLLMANAVTGAASLFRRELLDRALPFPPAQFAHYHDHWLALTALLAGGIEYVDRPLYDYVQHGRAALGHAAATRVFTLTERARKLRGDQRERVRFYRATYFRDVERLMVFATVLQMRCGESASPEQRRTLERFLSLERSWPALGSLGWRATRELTGQPETLGAEWSLFRALLWRRALSASARDRPTRRLRLDAVPPAELAPKGERRALGDDAARALAQKIEPLELAVSDEAPARVNLLIPTIDLDHLFGGYITKFNLARRLAASGARVRLVTVDPVGELPRDWKRQVESYSGLDRLFEHVEIEFARQAGSLEVSPRDSFIATTWWTAHIAARAGEALGGRPFVYLIQEFEPFTFPMGSHAALADQSYRFEHFALFSSELLRGYFRAHRLGVFATNEGDERSAAFQNAITPVAAPTVAELKARSTRRLLFYARPEAHAARNMFELGVLALGRALEEGAFRSGWDLRGIGGVAKRGRIDLGGDVELELLPRTAQREYGALLAEHDVGLALMYTPHPSLVPLEMASAGLLTVTNTFENKTAEALAAMSSNLIAAEPTVEGVAAALIEAGGVVADAERRVAGSRVQWPRDWDACFHDALLGRVLAWLDEPALAPTP
jgi:glycosyltransferase involved in cell wall biosynthesis